MTAWKAMKRPERIEALKRLIADGHTITEIAERLHASRGAISGMLARAGLTTGNKQPTGLQKVSGVTKSTLFNTFAKNPAKKKARDAKHERQNAAEHAREEQERVKRLGKWEPLAGSYPRALDALNTISECTWPLWHGLPIDEKNPERRPDVDAHQFCGEPCIDYFRPYCRTHTRMAYLVMPEIRHPIQERTIDEQDEREPLHAVEAA